MSSVTIPNSVTSIGSYAFRECSGLASITIPNSVTSIGSYAFSVCYLKVITIGDGIKSIGENAFLNYGGLQNVYCYAKNVPSTGNNAWGGSENAILHVPSQSMSKYAAHGQWNKFKEIVSLDGSSMPKCDTPSIEYTDGTIVFSCNTEGVEFASSITDVDIKNYNTSSIPLTATYYVNVYATKEGYESSEVAKATLCWIDKEPVFNDTTTDAMQVKSTPVLIQLQDGQLILSGVTEGQAVSVYSASGNKVCSTTCSGGKAILNVSSLSRQVIIVKIGTEAVKVLVD